MEEEKRKFHRVAINAFVRFYQEPFDTRTQQYRQGVVKSYSDGGISIVTDHPLPRGSVVTVELPIESDTKDLAIIQIRGVVRWVRRVQGRPGMGIEFSEFNESQYKNFNEWMTNLIAEYEKE